jgi:hypothetical protein
MLVRNEEQPSPFYATVPGLEFLCLTNRTWQPGETLEGG